MGLSWRRLARIVALAVIIGIGFFNLYQAALHWTLSDAAAYWNAGMRLREGRRSTRRSRTSMPRRCTDTPRGSPG